MTPKKLSEEASSNITLSEAATQFLTSLPLDERLKSQLEIKKFIRWFGERRLINVLSMQEVANYAEQLNFSTSDPPDKFDPVKHFLTFSYKRGLTIQKLTPHFKVKRSAKKLTQSSKSKSNQSISLTQQGYSELESELNSLKEERPLVAAELKKAAADKDFRENAPLEAVREYQGKLEARIKELESTLKVANIIDEKREISRKVTIGDTIVLKDLINGDEITYTLVDSREANPSKGKVSITSPIGQALLGHTTGEDIQVNAPVGKLPYRIEAIK
jgi:transcription elongation factor GreA